MSLNQLECISSIRSAKFVNDSLFVCVSKDQDGRSPYSLLAHNESVGKDTRMTVFSSIDECLQAVDRGQSSATYFSFCGTRDDDGHSPYQRVVYNSVTVSYSKVGESFKSLSECISSAAFINFHK